MKNQTIKPRIKIRYSHKLNEFCFLWCTGWLPCSFYDELNNRLLNRLEANRSRFKFQRNMTRLAIIGKPLT